MWSTHQSRKEADECEESRLLRVRFNKVGKSGQDVCAMCLDEVKSDVCRFGLFQQFAEQSCRCGALHLQKLSNHKEIRIKSKQGKRWADG